MSESTQSPWLNGAREVARYARMAVGDARRLMETGAIETHRKPERADGTRPRGRLVYAPDVDAFLLSQPSACEGPRLPRR